MPIRRLTKSVPFRRNKKTNYAVRCYSKLYLLQTKSGYLFYHGFNIYLRFFANGRKTGLP